MTSTAQHQTARRQSKLKFYDSAANIVAGDYECMICYTELEPKSGLMQTACCLNLACTGCIMKAFYHSIMARDQTFKCPMCRGIIVEVPDTIPLQPDGFELELAGNLDSMDESDIEANTDELMEEPDLTAWYLAHLAVYLYPSLQFNPTVTHLEPTLITDSMISYTTWSHVYRKVTISFCTDTPHTIMVSHVDADHVVRWHYADLEIEGIWITPFDTTNPANQPIFITIISKPIEDGPNRRVIIRELNSCFTVINKTFWSGHQYSNINRNSHIVFNPSTRHLIITHTAGAVENISL
jgi:hypothetical protein